MYSENCFSNTFSLIITPFLLWCFLSTCLGKFCTVVHDQAWELTQLCQQLPEGREASFSLSQHLKDLLIQEDPDSHLGQGHQEQGHKMAEHLVCKLSTGEVAIYPDYTKVSSSQNSPHLH
jgi:hypothetical protein